MERYVSARARVAPKAIVGLAVILGPSVIGEESVIDSNVIVGYPRRAKLAQRSGEWIELLDRVSSGARIGRRCHLRSGTIVYEDVVLGDGVETGHNVLIREETRIGDGTIVGTGTVIEGHVAIGRRVRIESRAFIPIGSVIGDDVFIGPCVVLTNDKYPMSRKLKAPIIEDGAVICANAVILPGVRIGRRAVVAAGAVVTRDVPPETVVMGAPAKPVATRDEYEQRKAAWEKS